MQFEVLQDSFLRQDGESWDRFFKAGEKIEYSSGHIDLACLRPIDDAAKAFAKKNPAPDAKVVLERLAQSAAGASLKPLPLAA